MKYIVKHVNTGAKAHSNTGNYSHTNVAEIPHADTYSNSGAQDVYYEADEYNEVHPYSEYSEYSCYYEDYDAYTDYDCYSDYTCYSCGYGDYSCDSGYSLTPPSETIERNTNFPTNVDVRSPNPPASQHYQSTGAHTNTYDCTYSCHTDNYDQNSTYEEQAGQYTESAVVPHQNTSSYQHGNTGYTDHINTTTNTQPSNVNGFKPTTRSAYYKTTVNLTWTKATDDKCISVISASYGDKNIGRAGIYEYATMKIDATRGISIGCWNVDGVWNNGMTKDTYGDISLIDDLKSYINSLSSGSYIAIGTEDAIESDQNLPQFKEFLSSYGFKTQSVMEGTRSCFAGIFKKDAEVLDEQSYRYGTDPFTAGSVSAQHTILGSGTQTITYIIQYSFKPIGGSYGAWTDAGSTTSLTYAYSLASHTSGRIKFRVIANDGMESSPEYMESSELRVLKYNAPDWVHNTNRENIATAASMGEITLEINKLSTELELGNSSLKFDTESMVHKTQIQHLREKINAIATVIEKNPLNDDNTDFLYSEDVNNIKKFIEEV